MAGFTAEDGRITEIKLYPITLDMHLPRKKIGSPRIADDDAVLHHLKELCKPYNTEFVIENNIATVKL